MLPEKVEANERIRQTQAELRMNDHDRLPFLCECDDVFCRAIVRLTAVEYADVRSSRGRFVVLDAHLTDGRAVKIGEGYVVAES